jgi:hypothetical protein
MIRIEIETAEVKTKSGIAAKSGKPYSIREQAGWAYVMGRDGQALRHPVKCSLTLRDDQPPYQPGNYQLSPASIYTNKFDQFEVAPVLVPLAVAEPKQIKAA